MTGIIGLSGISSTLPKRETCDFLPGRNSGKGALLFVTALPLAYVGLILSFLGRKSTSRRGLAIAGLVFSLVFFAVLCLGVAAIIVGWWLCSRQPECP